MADFLLRVHAETGQFLIQDLTAASTLYDLKKKISEMTHFPIGTFEILTGYPPRAIDYPEDNSLDFAGINSGDALRIRNLYPTRSPANVQIPAMPVVDAASCGDFNIEQLPNPYQFGTMMRVDVPSNNSCLFVSMQYLLSGGKMEPEQADNLRGLIANAVSSDLERYNEGFLGMSNANYCHWIQNPNHWGGAIELSILSDHYGIEIVAIDVCSLAFLKFGEAKNYVNRVFLLYDGIHYEPMVLDTAAEDGLKQTMFATNDEYAVVCAREVAQEAKSSRQFVDMANFTLKCQDCGMGLRGEQEAREHAHTTRHAHFSEVREEQ